MHPAILREGGKAIGLDHLPTFLGELVLADKPDEWGLREL
jgi:hypothetical protein